MFGIGKIIASPIRLLNVPLRVFEKLVAADERSISIPLETIAEAVEEAVEGEED